MAETTTNTSVEQATVFVVDDDKMLREMLYAFLESEGLRVEAYPTARAFLDAYNPARPGCLVLDIDMPGISGLELQQTLAREHVRIPIIFLTGKADIPATIQAFKTGAMDFLVKPVSNNELLSCIHKALARDLELHAEAATRMEYRKRFERLTPREQEVMSLIVRGMTNKAVAKILKISPRTVEGHRYRIMERMQATSLLQLTRIAGFCQLPDVPPDA